MCFIKKDHRPKALLKKETPAWVFPVNFKNTFFTEHFGETAFVLWWPVAANQKEIKNKE